VLGLDEAGRGSVLGPLVVGGFLVGDAQVEEVRRAGARDSKLLTPQGRERVYRNLAQVGERHSITISPAEVDVAVRRGELNLLEARAFARLIRRTAPAEAYVDACDPVAARFGRVVSRLAGDISVVRAAHHADRDNPIVGAASVVAKVRRDRAIGRLSRTLGLEIGSGYPSDPRTIAVVRATLGGAHPDAPWIRHSWRTAERLKPPHRIVPLEVFGR
jgi:ribonuclease HII